MNIRSKVSVVLGVVLTIAILVIGVVNYKLSVNTAMGEAKEKGRIILNYAYSSMKYVKRVQKPLMLELVEKDRYYPEVMSGFAVARSTYEIFTEEEPTYKLKQATLDPLLSSNKADQYETDMIAEFQKTPALKAKEGVLTKDGKEYFYFAKPMPVEQKCLRCHGDPADAPKDQIEIYGSKNGYNWKLNDICAAFVVYVPIENAMRTAKKSAGILLLFGAISLILTLVVIWVFLDRNIVLPVMNLSSRTEAISVGENLNDKIELDRKDEIGVLAKAIERLRVSIVKILAGFDD